MDHHKYDIAIIGAGPGGYVAAIRAAQMGFKTVCIDKRKTLGGTCLNVGCIPSKALLQSSENYAWIGKKGAEQGIVLKDLQLNFPQMMERKSQVVKGLVDGVAGLFKRNQVTWMVGQARFLDPHVLEVIQESDKCTLEAKHIILATGSESISLPFLPFDEKKVVSSTGVLELPQIPEKLAVIGAGVIGVELASVYQRLGSQVTLIEMLDRICPPMDQMISKMFLQILKKQGLEFHLSAQVKSGTIEEGGVTLTYTEGGQESSLFANVVLVAVGRRPYTQDLGLSEIGVQIDSKGFVEVDGHFRTKYPHLYAIGDVIQGPMLAHRASEEGIAVVELIAGNRPHLNYMAIPNVIYTHPEVAALGLTESEARDMGMDIKIGTSAFRGNARARCMGEVDGIVKIIGEALTGRLIGLHILGPHASEMIGEGVIAIEKRATLEEIAYASHAHPTLSETIKEAALGALGRAIHV